MEMKERRTSRQNSEKTWPNEITPLGPVEQQKPVKPYTYTNALTGENLKSYAILPFEKSVASTKSRQVSNPINGLNMRSYNFSPDEKMKTIKKRG
ncbi:hypothetical protein Ciccas_006839 [Cichlidogyrus casuarinus]|uniref:Uncharacterized protein n=1 Tax=Cichlidogyrus casuarinus TaxID=1844966 RepID=A0ABD2Q5N8_9PLAT